MQDSIRRHPSGQERRPRRRLVATAGVGAGLLLLGSLLGFGLGRDPTTVASPLVGQRAPAFALPAVGGSGTIRLSSLRGRIVVVNFWSSTCLDCRAEHPALAAAWERYRDQGVVLVGIDFEDQRGAAEAFAHRLSMDWPLALDPGQRVALRYGVYGVPETFFISPSGRVVAKQVGRVSYALLSREIERMLPEVTG